MFDWGLLSRVNGTDTRRIQFPDPAPPDLINTCAVQCSAFISANSGTSLLLLNFRSANTRDVLTSRRYTAV